MKLQQNKPLFEDAFKVASQQLYLAEIYLSDLLPQILANDILSFAFKL